MQWYYFLAITATTAIMHVLLLLVNLTTLANTGSVLSGSTLAWSLNHPPLSITDTLTTAQVVSAVSVTDTLLRTLQIYSRYLF
ncbi:MAG: hypothetical protein IPN46_17460 [Saprospiraceae bacterium]|nr:hypothetical protein [Saprospiraceae bacterium]